MKTIVILLLSCSCLLAQKFASIGDYGDSGSDELAVANLVKSWNPDFIITLGDNNYNEGLWSTIDENIGQYYHEFIFPYIGSYGSGADTNRFFPSPGNHDHHNLMDLIYLQPYLDYFDLLPYSGTTGNERYYDFVWGNVHFFSVNSCFIEPDGYSHPSVQSAWLETQLNNCVLNHSHWKIVYFHHSPYSSGPHGSQSRMQWPFKEWGADVVMAGHDHTYERLIVDDLPYFVNGLGGKSRYEFETPIPGSIVRYREKYGAMLMTADESHLTFSFFSVDSELIDFYEIINALPAAPTNLVATVVSQTQIDLSWIDNSSNEDGFRIERKLGTGGVYTEIATVGANLTIYQSTGLMANTEYCYRVRAYNTGGNSGHSNEDCATTNPTIPTSPSDLTAEATGVNEVTLNWTDNSNNEDGFIIERENLTLLDFAVIDSVGSNVTSYIDSTISQGVSYNYRISAFNISGPSGYTNVFYVTTILPSPTNLVGQLFGGPPYSVVLNWQESSINELGFVIERDTVGLGSFETLDSVEANVTFYEDTNFVNPVDTLCYRIYAFSQDTVSDYSNIAEIIIPVELVSFTANVFEHSVTLNWTTATETNNMGFELERKLYETWEKLVFIEGTGSTTEESNYQYTDEFKYLSFKGVILYRLKQIDFSGIYEYTDFIEINVDFTPKEFVLYQNYPNPFNPTTKIRYEIPGQARNDNMLVTLKVYDVLGNEVAILVNERMEAGRYEVTLDASSLSSGVYIYRLQVNSYLESKMMVILK